MRKLILFLILLVASTVYAAGMSSTDATLIESAGIPLYDKATFVYGNKDVGFRFASSEPVENARQWYRQQLPGWAVFDEFGTWIMYNGKAGLGMGEVMSRPQVMIQKNDSLPEWHKLDRSMTTEIVIMVPQ